MQLTSTDWKENRYNVSKAIIFQPHVDGSCQPRKHGQNLVWWMMVDPSALLTLMSQYCWLGCSGCRWSISLSAPRRLEVVAPGVFVPAPTGSGRQCWNSPRRLWMMPSALGISRVFPGLIEKGGYTGSKWIMTSSSLNQVSAVGAKACRPPEEMHTNTIGIPWPDKTSAIVKPCFSASRPYGQSEVCTGNISTYTHIM